MSRVALPRIASVLADRQDAIQRDLDQAEAMKRQAEAAEASYNKALSEARSQAEDIVAATKAEIQADLDKAIVKADAEIAAKAAESEKAIKVIRDNALKSVAEVANATGKDVVDAIAPGLADGKAIEAAVTKRMKG